MVKRLLKDYVLIILVAGTLLVKLASLQSDWVERQYTHGIYPYLAKAQRAVLRPIPFSVGDLLYAAAGLYFVFLIYQAFAALRSKGGSRVLLFEGFVKCFKILLIIYVWFNVLWGLNYNRLGIAHQLQLQDATYTLEEVTTLAQTLQQRLNHYAAQVDTLNKEEQKKDHLFAQAFAAYKRAAIQYPYFTYAYPTVKSSLYTGVGHYFGFTGYYNPFTGEAQIKTTIPLFLQPFVTLHEIAHQLGYAKENEANFVAFLSGRHGTDAFLLYSVYYNLYRYAAREIHSRDEALYLSLGAQLHPQVLRDNEILKAYLLSTQNKIEPLITLFYDQFLKVNNQKEGVQTYNRVVALLIAYQKKFGSGAI